MMSGKSTIERAFEIARTGSATKLDDIRRQLAAENFTQIDQHLFGPSIAKQLKQAIDQARAQKGS